MIGKALPSKTLSILQGRRLGELRVIDRPLSLSLSVEWVSRKVLRRGNNKKKNFNVPYCFKTSYLTFSRGNSARNAINLFTIWHGGKKSEGKFHFGICNVRSISRFWRIYGHLTLKANYAKWFRGKFNNSPLLKKTICKRYVLKKEIQIF